MNFSFGGECLSLFMVHLTWMYNILIPLCFLTGACGIALSFWGVWVGCLQHRRGLFIFACHKAIFYLFLNCKYKQKCTSMTATSAQWDTQTCMVHTALVNDLFLQKPLKALDLFIICTDLQGQSRGRSRLFYEGEEYTCTKRIMRLYSMYVCLCVCVCVCVYMCVCEKEKVSYQC